MCDDSEQKVSLIRLKFSSTFSAEKQWLPANTAGSEDESSALKQP